MLVSAVLSRGGNPAALLREWLAGACEPVVSPALIDELERVLAHPKPSDDYLTCLAEVGTAVLVSGDGHLHGLAGHFPIHTPSAFRALLTDD